MFFDLALALLLALGAVTYQVGGLDMAVPLAGGQLVSFAAALFVVNSASGLYEPQNSLSLSRSCARAVFVLLIVLPAAYAIFGLLPTQFSSREAVQFSVMAGVSALVLRRVYVSQRSAVARGRTRILIFGAGQAAQVVGATLRSADPNAVIVGFVPGPNETETASSALSAVPKVSCVSPVSAPPTILPTNPNSDDMPSRTPACVMPITWRAASSRSGWRHRVQSRARGARRDKGQSHGAGRRRATCRSPA